MNLFADFFLLKRKIKMHHSSQNKIFPLIIIWLIMHFKKILVKKTKKTQFYYDCGTNDLRNK